MEGLRGRKSLGVLEEPEDGSLVWLVFKPRSKWYEMRLERCRGA